MIPDFRHFIMQIGALQLPRHIIDRCNLTILLEPGYEDLSEFLANNKVEIIASMPCYSAENVNAQRGEGVFEGSIAALQLLNSLGYGIDPHLPLHLVYNPVGAFLPPSQDELEVDYKRELKKHFGIEFNKLYALSNLPIGRFASYLRHKGKLEEYMELLVHAFNPATVSGLMCRNTISVGWRGEVYDCDFNQQLGLQWMGRDGPPGRPDAAARRPYHDNSKPLFLVNCHRLLAGPFSEYRLGRHRFEAQVDRPPDSPSAMNRPSGNDYTLPGSEAQRGSVGQLDLQPALEHQKELIRPGMLVPRIVASQYAQS